MFFMKGKEVYLLLSEYLNCVQDCHNTFVDSFDKIFAGVSDLEIEALANKVDKLESKADSKRHEIIKAMLNGALLPESRGEILKLIDITDEIANKCEDVIRNVYLQNITFHDEIKLCITNINIKTKEQYSILHGAIESLFIKYDIDDLYQKVNTIEKIESEVDDLEQQIIKKIYKMNIELAEKNLLRDMISNISDISDIIEDISDIIEMIMALRKV